MIEDNIESALEKATRHLKSGSRRQLSPLRKILIVKTFGISQFIYLMQCLSLNANNFKRINHLLYTFIWNRHFASAKAPERISRELVTKSIREGGLGMIDLEKLDRSLKITALGRMDVSEHPMLKILKNNLRKIDGKLNLSQIRPW